MSSEIKTECDKLCIFCLKICPSRDKELVNNCSRNGDTKDCDFNGICEDVAIVNSLARFLEGFTGQKVKVPLGDITTGYEWKAKGVGCCVDCRLIINFLCSVYHQLKCLELQLEWKLGTLVNIMKMANRIPSRAQQLQKVFQQENNEYDGGNDIASQLTLLSFKWFRKDVVKQCKAKLSTTKPRVFLQRLKDDNAASIIGDTVTVRKSAATHHNLEINVEMSSILISSIMIDSDSSAVGPNVNPLPGKEGENGGINETERGQTANNADETPNYTISKTPTPTLTPTAVLSLGAVISLALPIQGPIPVDVTTKNEVPVESSVFVDVNDENTSAINVAEADEHDDNVFDDLNTEWNDEPDTDESPENESPHLASAVELEADEAINIKSEEIPIAHNNPTEKSPFQCKNCSKEFTEMWILKRHVTTQHRKKNSNIQGESVVLLSNVTTQNHEQIQHDATREQNVDSETCQQQTICKVENETFFEKDKPTPQRYSFRERRKRSFSEVHQHQKVESDFEDDTPEDAYSAGSDSSSSFSECEDDSALKEKVDVIEKQENEPKSKAMKKVISPYSQYCREDGCNRHFSIKRRYNNHQRLHAPGIFQCHFCDTVETNVIRLGIHERTVHPSSENNEMVDKQKQVLHCSRCNFKTSRIPLFEWHFAEMHIEGFGKRKPKPVKYVQCEICKVKVLKSRRTINRHFRERHNIKGLSTFVNTTGRCIVNFENGGQKMQIHLENERQPIGGKQQKLEKVMDNIGTDLKCQRCNLSFRNEDILKLHELQCDIMGSCMAAKLLKRTPRNMMGISSNIAETCPAAKLLKRNYGKWKLKCPVENCPEKFVTPLGLETHKELHGSYKCKFCEVVKDHPMALAVHETEHAIRAKPSKVKTGKKIFHCARCPKNYLLKNKLLRHYLKQHLNLSSKLPVQKCKICSSENRGGTEDYFPEHYRIHHNTVGMDPSDIQRCHQCSAYFIKSEQLTNHLIIIHFKRKCPECGKPFIRRPSPCLLRKHIEQKHPFSRVFPHLVVPCDMGNCKRKFANEAELNLHKAQDRHYDESVVKCSECDKEFQGEEKLRAHMRILHRGEESIICPECGKSFKSKGTLQIHLEYHKDPKEWRFQCVTCGKKCVDKQKLTEHQRTHTKEKPFVCQLCGERYAHRHNWRSHMKTKHKGQYTEAERVIKTSGNYLSRKGSKKGDCITAGASTATTLIEKDNSE